MSMEKPHDEALAPLLSPTDPLNFNDNVDVAVISEHGADDDLQDVGSSSFGQTVFNTANVIMGVSLLSLPSAFKSAGWIPGVFLLAFFGLTANYCAKLLVQCQRMYLRMTGSPLLSYGDIGEAAFGPRGRWFIQTIFMCELFSACVALLILVTESIGMIFPDWNELLVKVCVWTVLTASTWPKSLSVLSYGSMLGVLCLLNLIIVLFVDGFTKPTAPGSLLDPVETHLFPAKWYLLPQTFGNFMAGYAGHACFPGFYASMRRPEQFPKALNYAFGIGFCFYLTFASAGYLMFGEKLHSMITFDLNMPEYSWTIYVVTIVLVIINPATKYPLTLYPVLTVLEKTVLRRLTTRRSAARSFAQSHASSPLLTPSASQASLPALTLPPARSHMIHPRTLKRVLFRTVVSGCVLAVAIAFPHFERVIGLLGSLFSITASILFPILCYLALFKNVSLVDSTALTPGKSVSKGKKALLLSLWTVVAILGVLGTVWSLLPEAIMPRK